MVDQVILDEVAAVKVGMERVKGLVEHFSRNKNWPLDRKWRVFSEAVHSGTYRNSDFYHLTFKVMEELNLTWYDDFYIDRYQTVNLVDFVDENFAESLMDMPEEEAEKLINKFRQEVLDKGFTHFTYDW